MLSGDYVKKENIIPQLTGEDNNSIIKEMVEVLTQTREEIETTAVGKGDVKCICSYFFYTKPSISTRLSQY